jgi:hypothetical protein
MQEELDRQVSFVRAMHDPAEAVLKTSVFSIAEGRYRYVRVAGAPQCGEHLLVVRRADSSVVITREESSVQLDGILELYPAKYALVVFVFAVPLYSPLLHESLGRVLARYEMAILMFSLSDAEYLLVREDRLSSLVRDLKHLGLIQKPT